MTGFAPIAFLSSFPLPKPGKKTGKATVLDYLPGATPRYPTRKPVSYERRTFPPH